MRPAPLKLGGTTSCPMLPDIMLFDGSFVLDLALLTAGYWIVDWAFRQDAYLGAMRRLGIRSTHVALGLWALGWTAVAPFWSWHQLPAGPLLRILALVLVATLAWGAVTKDIDLGTGQAQDAARLLLLAATVGVAFSPAFLPLAGLLLTTPFGLWEHHATLPMRMVQALVAYVALAAVMAMAEPPMQPLGAPAALVFFLLVIQISHYLITALAKMLLGPKWYSWSFDNRLHHLAASAYSWGWARFLPWPKWLRVVRWVRLFERPMQLGVFALELLAPLALWHPAAAIALGLGWTTFHLGVFLVSGLLFWDWMLANLAMAYLVVQLPSDVAAQVFGPVSVLIGLVFMAAFPLRHKLWKPMPLAWFDSPFTQRMHWQVRGASGTRYGLYNDYMCPHERLYGKVHGCFLAPVAVVTYHLGEVWKPELRDALRAAGPDRAQLDEVRERFGITPRCEAMATQHAAYLRRYFSQLNQGARKHWLPRGLRWLKAPGGQIFHWGDLPAFRGQEEVTQVVLIYREEYFDGQQLHRLRDQPVLTVDIPGSLISPPVHELTPKEIDDFLLSHAVGRLIDLPDFKKGYIHADDGKRVNEAG